MLISEEAPRNQSNAPFEGGLGGPGAQSSDKCCELFERSFGVPFTILDGSTGEVLHAAAGQPALDWQRQAESCREVARRGRPEFIEAEDPFLVFALPLESPGGNSHVAVATFVSRAIDPIEDLSVPATTVGLPTEEATSWASRQTLWPAETLQRVGELLLAQLSSKRRIKELEDEATSLSLNLANTYEEISLLYRLTQNLKISESDEDLGRVTLEWMKEVLPAEGLAIQLVPADQRDDTLAHDARSQPVLLSYGDCPVDNSDVSRLIEHLGLDAASWPVVVNLPVTQRHDWPCPQVRQLIAVSLAEGENLFGHLVALNHVDGAEFGTVEASLINSVAAILGIHSGNIELYRQQSELLAGIVRALTSAIDAKDPYTCGHSDRVARVSVRLGAELGCSRQTLNTMYLSGLLHDIGKIGISDAVLRKPGRLSESEYEHIKQHVTIGHKILRDLKKLDDVLPVVLHHHESWDGGGYPEELGSEAIPLSARIVAVADAYDAMGSDRPYRQGMPDKQIDKIFRAGAGTQWDPEVVEAFFRVRDDIRKIAEDERDVADIDLEQWT